MEVEHTGLKFFASYLKSRKFRVRFGGNTSGKFAANSGIPQGSNLGPLLFIIFINDLPKVLSSVNCLLYADDLKLFYKIETLNDSVILQNDINNIYNWSLQNKLYFNLSKCFVVTFTRNIHKINFEYSMNNESIKRVETIQDLGVTFNSKLNFGEHINRITGVAFRMLGFVLRTSKNFRNLSTIERLYCSLVRPRLEYASVVWHSNQITFTNNLEKVQKRYLRYLYYKKYNEYPNYNVIRTVALRREFQIQSLDSRRKIMLVMFAYKIINNFINDNNLLLLLDLRVPARNTRIRNVFQIPAVYMSQDPRITMFKLINEISCLTELDFSLTIKKFLKIVTEFFGYD